MDAGLQRARGYGCFAIVAHQANADVFGPKKKCHHLYRFGPVRIIPRIIGNEYCMPPPRPDHLVAPFAGYFHFVTSLQRDREPWKVRDISKHGRSNAEFGKMHSLDACCLQKSIQFASNIIPLFRMSGD
jgi:hypothetical protein